jgi:hypothetical protein
MAETRNIGDVVATVGTFQRDGVTKGRTLKLGTAHQTGRRVWLSLHAHVLNSVLVNNMHRASKQLGFGVGNEVTVSILGKDGAPVTLDAAPESDDTTTNAPNAEDGIDF